jgi:hypothetical protein
MTRTKLIARQIILDKSFNVKSKLARVVKKQNTKEDKSIKKTRFLLKNARRKSRRFKQESK